VLTIRTEITDRMLIFGTRHLHRVLAEYAAHYNMRRPHRALHLPPPHPRSPAPELIHDRIRPSTDHRRIDQRVRDSSLRPQIRASPGS
jgi:putative transposase